MTEVSEERTAGHRRNRMNPAHLLVRIVAGFLFLPVALASDKKPQRVTVTLDPSKTAIRWTLADPLHTVHGTFKLKRGVVNINPADGSADGLIEVDAVTGESGSEARDSRMQKNVLESGRFPAIDFRPTHVTGKVESNSDEDLAVDGVFSIHGADHPLQLKMTIHHEGTMTTAKTHFVIPYVEWGMKDPSTFVLRVGKTVDVDVESTTMGGN